MPIIACCDLNSTTSYNGALTYESNVSIIDLASMMAGAKQGARGGAWGSKELERAGRGVLRFCVIGVGRAGLVHAANIQHRLKQAELVALCDPDAEGLARVGRQLTVERRYSDYHEALRDSEVEAVVIAAPAFAHREIASEAAAQGKHIFLEKPMAL
ncbi:MAG: Gfo/Idh/MocA family oxidoreductase, partial [Anaerolineae bacterium]|nr:Gfo/Idh/MocA family oxidoreductase [Anaerolineae bacterium]